MFLPTVKRLYESNVNDFPVDVGMMVFARIESGRTVALPQSVPHSRVAFSA